ncbi:MAG: prolyl oligopeptidase family serine peptidase [Tissierellia bacterium]|nr:prolyl oligopeptidase family serine peptidase [Tissierellia bacterium]
MNFQGLIEIDIDIAGVTVTELSPMIHTPTEAVVYYHGYSSSRNDSLFYGRLLASMGYLVLVYEQKGHGHRSHELKLNFDAPDEKFWDVVISSITESPNLINYLVEKKGIHPQKIVFSGHSMGAMVAAGVFIKSPIGKLVCYNGSLDFRALNTYFCKNNHWDENKQAEVNQRIQYYSPADHISRLENRPILLVDGEDDRIVPCQFNVDVLQALRTYYKDKSLLQHLIIDHAGHALTLTALRVTGMFLERRNVENYGI